MQFGQVKIFGFIGARCKNSQVICSLSRKRLCHFSNDNASHKTFSPDVPRGSTQDNPGLCLTFVSLFVLQSRNILCITLSILKCDQSSSETSFSNFFTFTVNRISISGTKGFDRVSQTYVRPSENIY